MAFASIYLDMSQVFCHVPQPCFTSGVIFFDIIILFPSWLLLYLTQVSQSVSFDVIDSIPKPVPNSVIMGSPPNPLLFLLHSNDAITSITQGVPSVFADDNK